MNRGVRSMRSVYEHSCHKLNQQKNFNHKTYLYQINQNSCETIDKQQTRSYHSDHSFVMQQTYMHYCKTFIEKKQVPFPFERSIMYMSTRVSKRKDPCPFEVLGVPKKSPYKVVKKAFFKLALQHHPDTQNNQKDDESSQNGKKENIDPVELFHRIRTAFESLMEDSETGMAIPRPIPEDEEESSIWKDNKEFDSWFKAETGYNAPFMFEMDPETMKEVAAVTENNEGGGLDRGGMWHLAKMVSQNVKDNEGSGSMTGGIPQLESGEVQDDKKTRLSRRRRRPR